MEARCGTAPASTEREAKQAPRTEDLAQGNLVRVEGAEMAQPGAPADPLVAQTAIPGRPVEDCPGRAATADTIDAAATAMATVWTTVRRSSWKA